MPTYRIPASLYIEAENVHAALQTATKYLDDAANELYDPYGSDYPGLVAVDVEPILYALRAPVPEQPGSGAEECPPAQAED